LRKSRKKTESPGLAREGPPPCLVCFAWLVLDHAKVSETGRTSLKRPVNTYMQEKETKSAESAKSIKKRGFRAGETSFFAAGWTAAWCLFCLSFRKCAINCCLFVCFPASLSICKKRKRKHTKSRKAQKRGPEGDLFHAAGWKQRAVVL